MQSSTNGPRHLLSWSWTCYKNDSKVQFLVHFLVHFRSISATLYPFVLIFYLHCSHKPAGDTLNPCGIPGRTGVLLGAGSWSMGAEGVCVSATVLEPGSLKVTIGTPDTGPRAAPETALNPTLPYSPPCTASCSSRCLLFLNLLLQ